MPERSEKLRSTLHELESELSSLDTLDDETRAALEAVLNEISHKLNKSGPAGLQREDSLVARLQDAAEDFETSHPTLFGIVSRTIDALGQMGI